MLEEREVKSGIEVKGFFRLQITEQDKFEQEKVVGDSGWNENAVVNLGFNQYLVMSLGSIAGSKYITHMALGTGSAPGAADTTLNGELAENVRAAVTAASSSGSKTVRFTATFASANSFVTASRNISNVGLFNTSSGGTIFAGNTFASSSVATNQAVNATWIFKSGVEFLVTGIEKLRKFGEHLLAETIPSQALACA